MTGTPQKPSSLVKRPVVLAGVAVDDDCAAHRSGGLVLAGKRGSLGHRFEGVLQQVAEDGHQAMDLLGHGAWLVALASVADPAQLGAAVAQALGYEYVSAESVLG